MITMAVRFEVLDYGNWKQVYDNFASTRKEKGVTGASVYRDPDDSTKITVIHQFTNITAAREFVSSEELKSAMMEAGVAGAPDFWFTEFVEHTAH